MPSSPLHDAFVAQAGDDLAEDPRPQLPPDRRHDELVGERAVDGQVVWRRVQLVDDPDRQQQEAGAQAECGRRRQLDQRLLHRERIRVLEPASARRRIHAVGSCSSRTKTAADPRRRSIAVDEHLPFAEAPRRCRAGEASGGGGVGAAVSGAGAAEAAVR